MKELRFKELFSDKKNPLHVTLIRDRYGKDATEGRLYIGERKFFTIEDPWLDNKQSISCIPEGTYQVQPWNWSSDPRFKYDRVWHIINVQGREGILFHNGSFTEHTKGCILVGRIRTRIEGKAAVVGSHLAIDDMRAIIGNNWFTLTIKKGE